MSPSLPMRILMISLLLVLGLSSVVSAQGTSAFFLWEGETAHIGNGTNPEDITVLAIDAEGTEASISIQTAFENRTTAVSDGERVAYVYRMVDGTERYRSILVQDVSRKPPRIKVWLPSTTQVETIPIFQKILNLLSRLF